MLSDKIRQERQKKGLSQSELARRSGHAVSTIHGIENGDNRNPSFRTICDIAKVLGIPLDELYQDVLNEKKHSWVVHSGVLFCYYFEVTYLEKRNNHVINTVTAFNTVMDHFTCLVCWLYYNYNIASQDVRYRKFNWWYSVFALFLLFFDLNDCIPNFRC